MTRYRVLTLGCKANSYDSQLIEEELQRRGWLPASQDDAAELCIINSCTVTDEADRQSRRLASKLSNQNPGATVVITGCAAEVDPERLATSRGVSYVVGNSDKPRLVELALQARSTQAPSHTVLGQVRGYEEHLSRHPMDREWPSAEEQFPAGVRLEQGNTLRTRAFLKIQEGCNAFCTYCIIPYGRGPARSQEPERVIEQVQRLVSDGAREVILTGTNLGEYGEEFDSNARQPRGALLAALCARLLSETRLERLRVGSLDPTEIHDSLLELVQSSGGRLCPHFHVSLQSPLTRILRGMKRRYSGVETEKTLLKIAERLPDAFVGMDVITGFPGEDLAAFEETVQVLTRLPWSRLHVFPYSERSGTPATRMKGSVPQVERLRRARELNALSRARQKEWVESQVRKSGGVLKQILVERPVRWAGDGPDSSRRYWSGYTPNYLRVLIPVSEPNPWNHVISLRAATVLEDPQGHEVAIEAFEIPQV